MQTNTRPAHRALRILSALGFTATLVIGPASAETNAPVQVTHDTAGKKVVITLGGQPFTEVHYGAFPKPVLWPVYGPGGVPMMRDYPMKLGTPNEATDHVHQRSVFFMHGDVNGVDFWSEKDGADPAGKIITTSVDQAEVKDGVGCVTLKTKWVDKGGRTHCTDVRTLRFGSLGSTRYIDYDTVITAPEGQDVVLGDTKEGTMGVRTRVELQLNSDKEPLAKGQCVNSEGVKGKGIWAQKARWVDYWGPVEGKVLGVAILDHPSNLRHPTTWHAREYGLIAANPFGLAEFSKKWPTGGNLPAKSGNLTLKAGQSQGFKYRILLHEGDATSADVESAWKKWSGK